MTDTRLMHTVGARAMEWLWAHRDGFRLEPDVDPEVGFLERFKPIGELALICRVLFREGVAGSRQAELARKLLDHTWRHTLDGGRMLVRGQRIEPLSPIPFEVYLPYKELGYSEPEVERATVLYHRLDSWARPRTGPDPASGTVRVPAPVRPHARACPRRTSSAPPGWAARPSPGRSEGHIAYDITHTVFHLTDWGEHPAACRRTSPTTSPPGCRSGSTTGWTSKRWDLLGELLVVDACLPRPTLDERRLARASPPRSRPTAPCPPYARCRRANPDELFDMVYHPTLVAAFASVLATSRALSELAPRHRHDRPVPALAGRPPTTRSDARAGRSPPRRPDDDA